ncbi:inner membrane complex protein 1d, putative [Plasmodium sp. gorilla clade G2]|uniref:inner membrane complex protein 1d, putative n=1 Tax=Plasmodium sp. gorilla clade G2 TaxID=880535 RepID=UPI000D223F25|nr:inner membrane complex protein 1d, putative [Plasmodium sp. gorilla clade G2]SOV12926.1 inner membrane complex protein 1d, putative [Plasmodium sp. gorilla clade G2]
MEIFQDNKINNLGNIEINQGDGVIKKENDLHVSVIKPITKKTIHCDNTKNKIKINAFYKPVELVEEIKNYVQKGDTHLVKLYEDFKNKKDKKVKMKNEYITNLKKLNILNMINNNKKKEIECVENKNNIVHFNLFNENEDVTPKIETVYIPKLEKNIEVVSHLKENVNVDYTYMVPKPVVIPIEVPILKFRDHFKIIPIRKKIIPVIKYTDNIIYVDCCVEKPYIVYENVIIPVPCDIPIEQKKYIDKVPPI